MTLRSAIAKVGSVLRGAKAGPAAKMDLERMIQPAARSRWLLPRVRDITPDYIETVLRGAFSGNHVQQWELFDLMEDTWPRLAKDLNEIKRAVVKLNWKVEAWAEEDTAPTPEAEEKAKLVSRAFWKMQPDPARDDNGAEGTIYDILDAWAKGVSVLELLWDLAGRTANDKAATSGEVVPAGTAWVHPTNYAWHEEGWLGLRQEGQARSPITNRQSDLEPFPEDKFLIAICKGRSGQPLSTALLRPLAWWWCAANFGAEWLLNFAQIFGLPIRWATYDSARPGLLAQVSDMLANLGSAGWGAFPAGTTLELKEAAKSGQDNPQAYLLDLADKTADLLILGQTLTTEVGPSGSRALGEVHASVRDDIILAAADFAAGILNRQFIPAILRLNYGEASEAPELCPEPHKIEDVKANAERDDILLKAGVQMPKKWFYERHNIPLPQPGEEVISGPPAAPAGPAGARPPDYGTTGLQNMAARNGHGRFDFQLPIADSRLQVRDATEQLAENVLENLTGVKAKWLGGVKPFFVRLVKAAQDESLSDAHFLQALEAAQKQFPELFDDLDHDALAEAMEEAMGAAVVNGAVRGAMKRRAGSIEQGARRAR